MFFFFHVASDCGDWTEGFKIHASGYEGGWYLISGLGHKISCQTRNTIESSRDEIATWDISGRVWPTQREHNIKILSTRK